MEKNKTVTILGAGPSGMITGWLLSKKGWKVNIFEKDKMVGGMCRSWKWKNYTLDPVLLCLLNSGMLGILTPKVA